MDMHSVEQAIALLKASGYRVSKPRAKKTKDRVGPTFVATFADGQVTRMSTYTDLKELDWGRGERLSKAAWLSRKCNLPVFRNPMMNAELLAHCQDRWFSREHSCEIVAAHFEQDGIVLAQKVYGV